MMVDGVTPTEEGSAVVLADPRKKLGLLIFVGGTEALSLALRLSKKQYERPLTHDLLDSVLTRFEARVTSVRVDKLENDIFHGTIVLHANGRRLQIDARPSDALALAVGNEAPVFVADEVIEAAGIDLRTLNPEKLDPEISEGSRDSRGDVEL